MNKLYLHVGPHKTGTTSLQKFLLDNRAALFQSNLVYPKRYQTIFGHHQFRTLLDEQSLSPDDIAFFNENHNFLLSSEDFISLNKEAFEYLRNSIESKQVQVLFAWRRASFKLYSIWQETVKHGGTDTFFAYYHEHLARPGQSQMLSADLKLNMFCHVFGKENVKVLDYDAASRENNLLPTFCRMIDIPWQDNFVTPEKHANAVNRSMGIEDIEVIRALNHVFKTHYQITGPVVRNLYAEHQDSLLEAGLEELRNIVRRYEHTLKVGNYFIDMRCEKIMTDKFADNMVNYQPSTDLKTITLARPDWMFESKAHDLLMGLAALLKENVAS